MSTVVNRIIKYKRNLSAEERMRSVQSVLYPKFISSLNIMLYLHPLLDIMSKNTFYSLTPLGWSQGLCKAAVHVVVFTHSPKVGRGHCQLSIVAALICIMNHHHYWHYWGHRYSTIGINDHHHLTRSRLPVPACVRRAARLHCMNPTWRCGPAPASPYPGNHRNHNTVSSRDLRSHACLISS